VSALTERDRAGLDLERRPWRCGATKEAAIRAELDVSSLTWYYQVLNSLAGSADAWEYAPQALARVVRFRELNRLRRTA